MTLPRDVSSPREVAARLDAGVQILRIEVPGPVAVVTPEFPDSEYALDAFGIGDLVIPAYAYVLAYQLSFEYRSTDPENETYSFLNLGTFLDGADPNTGGPNLSLGLANAVDDWTRWTDASQDDYGETEQAVYLWGSPADESGQGGEFRDISGFFVYVSP